MMRESCLISGLVLILSTQASISKPNPPITLKVAPSICLQPCSIKTVLHVEPNEHNRMVSLDLWSEDFERHTMFETQHQPPTIEIWYKTIPVGDYYITATLIDDASEVVKVVSAHVIAKGLVQP